MMRRLVQHTRVRAAGRDLTNLIRYGAAAPRAHQLVFVRAESITSALRSGVPQIRSATVIDGDWDLAVKPLTEVAHIRQCLERWNGSTWEKVGAIDHVLNLIAAGGGVHGGMSSREDVEQRYDAVDLLHETVRSSGRLNTRREVSARGFREYGGILIHFGRDAQPIFNGWQGCHRLAAAIRCDLEWIPVQVGMVHRDATTLWRSTVRTRRPGDEAD